MFFKKELPLFVSEKDGFFLVTKGGGIMRLLAKLLLFVGVLGLVFVLVMRNVNFSIYFDQIGKEPTVDTKEMYIDTLRQAMLKRDPVVNLDFKGNSEEVHGFVSDAINHVFEVDDPSTNVDYDYLKYCYKSTEITIKGLFNSYQIEYKISYNETKKETDKVLSKVRKTLQTMNVSEMDDYHKIKSVHDYIINNAAYDLTGVNNSAYENLIGKKSVCQGYAAVTYLMMKEAGIDCRIITGTGKGVGHAWNIVKLNNKWYNIDCTWDDPVSKDGKQYLEYDYFLKSNADFINHIRDFEFESELFHNKYKMADISY